jgi:Mn-dependent DtxR family transcriptional regulator
MQFKDRINLIMEEIKKRVKPDETIHRETLILIIEDVLNVGNPTARKYITDLINMGLVEMIWKNGLEKYKIKENSAS